jgi:alkylation response protein AidB-like acyl-CoA dehydrogenase
MTGVLADPAAGLSDEEAMFLGVIRELTAAEIEPRAGAIEASGSVPDELAALLAESELATVTAPQAAGGAGGSPALAVRTVAAVAEASAAVATLAGHAQACAAAGATDAAPALADAEDLALAGDAVTGAAGHVVGAPGAGVLVVLAGEPVALAVEPDAAEIGAPHARTGLRGCPVAPVRLDGAPATRLGGADAVAAARALRRLALGAAAVGVSRRALREACEYTASRRQFGRPVAEFGAVARMLEAMTEAVAAAEALVHAAAARPDPPVADCARAARVATTTAVRVADDGVQLHGGYGYVDDYPAERLLRDAVTLRALAGGRPEGAGR